MNQRAPHRLLALVTASLMALECAAPASAETVAVISRFTITRDGQPFLDDTFTGAYASLAIPRMAGGQPTESPVFGGGQRNWTRAEFFVFEQAGTPAK